jgi:hypothetical protein
MVKNAFVILASLALVVVLAACAPSQATPQLLLENTQSNSTPFPDTAGTPQPNDQQNGAPGGFQNASLESKLAYGTLKLEGTSNAVTAEEAKKLLPLWQKISDLRTSGTPTPEDAQAVYTQIEQAMTPDQITAITQVTMNPQDFQSLMQTLGITITPGAGGQGFGNGNGQSTQTADQQATRTARRTQAAGTPGAGFSGTRTPGAQGDFGGRGGFGGFSSMFVDSLIKILTTRAG